MPSFVRIHRPFILITLLLVLGPAPLAAASPDAQAERPVVLVAGATGRLGRHLIEQAHAAGFAVRGITRDPVSARAQYGDQYEWVAGDIRLPESLPAAVADVDYVICAAGATTPTGPNAPQFVDYEGARNLIDAAVRAGVEQFVLVSSIGVTQRFHLLNLTFGEVLEWKWAAEEHLRASGLAYTIVRPGGLRPGPAQLEGVAINQGDAKGGSYIYLSDAASVIIATVGNPDALSKSFEMLSDRAAQPEAWRDALAALETD